MTRLLDYVIKHNKSFAHMTDYEKWEYREEVLAGMKEKAEYVGLFFAGAIALISAMFLSGLFGN